MDALKKIPAFLLMMLFLCYLGFQAYQFEFSDDGSVKANENKKAQIRSEIDTTRKKIAEAKEFAKTLDAKKDELRQKVKKMFEYESLFAERIDVPVLMKLFVTEARRVDLKLDKIQPVILQNKEYYFEQEFKMTMEGEFVHFMQFLQRIAQLQRLIRVVEIDLDNNGAQYKGSNLLTGTLTLKAYRYSNSKEDAMAGAFK
jgi:Tfp pilus assembly protein PilO